MSDLINRADALACFHDWVDSKGDVHSADEMPEYQRIEELPSAEPEIIRCKDCKNYKSYWGRCAHWERISTESVLVAESDFCSQAERRNQNEK